MPLRAVAPVLNAKGHVVIYALDDEGNIWKWVDQSPDTVAPI